MFNKLKKKSINGSNVRSYLLYALGEIILVVVGILIALQVNNRNMISIEKEQEVKMLKELNTAFISDTVNLDYFAKRVEYNAKSIGTLLDALSSKEEYHDSLSYYFPLVVTSFMWSEGNSAYKTLLSKGVDLISNDTIRNSIISIHTNYYETIKYADGGVYVTHANIQEYCLKNFDQVGSEAIDESGNYGRARMTPNNYEDLRSNPEYLSILRTVKAQHQVLLMILRSTKDQVKGTIEMIKKEVHT